MTQRNVRLRRSIRLTSLYLAMTLILVMIHTTAYGTTNTQLENESSVAVHTFSVYQLFWDSESFDLLDQDAVEVNSYKIATENLLAKRAGAGRDD